MIQYIPSRNRTAILFVLAGCLSLVCAYQSKADSTTLSLTECNTPTLCGAGSIFLQTATVNGTSVIEVTVTMASGFGLFGNGMGNGAIGWNGTNLLGVDPTSISPTTFGVSGGGNFNSFGSFQFSLDGPNPPGATSLTFNITCVGGCISVTQVTGFAAHVIGNGVTGFDATTGVPETPEPVSMLLFGTGLVAIGAKLRSRKSRNPVAA